VVLKLAISKDEVRHIARLARLELSDEEVEKFAAQLSQILDHAAKVRELDLEGLEPLAHAVDRVNVFREDAAKEGLSREDALANAPEKENGFFKIPPII
jgi:aspartyl-tRNA(Asn)/glutamyl-tRNA(Gln) amidotransferase subunit C